MYFGLILTTLVSLTAATIPFPSRRPMFDSVLPKNETRKELPVPKPTLDLDFRMVVDLYPRLNVGKGPYGQRNWIAFSGGRWAAKWGSGTVVAGGQDSQIVIEDLSAKLMTNYLLKTNDTDPAYIAIDTNGWRTGPREVLEALGDPERADSVPPTDYKFRLYVNLETGDPRYAHVNTKMWIGSGTRRGSQVIYDAYQIG